MSKSGSIRYSSTTAWVGSIGNLSTENIQEAFEQEFGRVSQVDHKETIAFVTFESEEGFNRATSQKKLKILECEVVIKPKIIKEKPHVSTSYDTRKKHDVDEDSPRRIRSYNGSSYRRKRSRSPSRESLRRGGSADSDDASSRSTSISKRAKPPDKEAERKIAANKKRPVREYHEQQDRRENIKDIFGGNREEGSLS